MSSERPPVMIAPSRSPSSRPGPIGGKRDENRQRRTQSLGQAALKLFLQRGIEAVTIDEIVAEAGTAKGSFYRYFADKTALVTALVHPVTMRFEAAITECAEALSRADHRAPGLSAAYRAFAIELASITMDHPDVVRLYLQENRTPPEGARAPIAALAKIVHQGALDLAKIAREAKMVREFPSAIAAVAVQGASEELLWRVLSGYEVAPLSEIPEALVTIVLEGVRARPAAAASVTTAPAAPAASDEASAPAEAPSADAKPASKSAKGKPAKR